MPEPSEVYAQSAATLRRVLYETKKVIVGQDLLLERILVALLARGHLLIEGVPGLAKTLAVRTVARVVGGTFRRIQFTPDLVPADLIGTRIYNPQTASFETELGPVFANLLLADEINRAPAKVQSALLEAMQERQVTIGKQTYLLPDPFLVLATQNPIESEGTYPLPEAQLDRFMMKVVIGYPTPHEEMEVVTRGTGETPPEAEQVIGIEELKALQRVTDTVYVHPQVREYAVNLVTATRDPARVGLEALRRYITFGASPRAALNLVLGAKALAVIRGREFALPVDVHDLMYDVLRHRLVLSYEALAEGIAPDEIIRQVVERVPFTEVHMGDPHADTRAGLEEA